MPTTNATTTKLLERSPVIVVMGHVDHGKTSLIDYIRKSNVAAKEAGEITQSVGAYEIEHGGKRITFIDTPGHEAFTAMRSRGAEIADIAILVVAADEGLKPQTKEAIKILHDTKTHFVVAITKVDKQNANIEKVKNDLTAAGVFLEGYGGQVSYQTVSAKTGDGVNQLLDLLVLTAEVEHLSYDPVAPASGYILEAKLDPRRGLEVTAIIKNGTLRPGDEITTPSAKGKVKILENFLEKPVPSLTPSSPAVIIGFESIPHVGEEFRTGSEVSTVAYKPVPTVTKRHVLAPLVGEEARAIRAILKSADAGTLEVLSSVVKNIPSKKPLVILDESVGDVTDNDVKTAIAGGAIIVGFKNKVAKTALRLAETHDVPIFTSEIIYHLVKAVEEYIAHADESKVIGELELLAIFNQDKTQRQVVGGKVTKGIFRNKAHVEIVRGDAALGSGRVLNLQQQKKDAGQVGEGNEAGLLVESAVKLATGDKLVIKKHKEEG